MEPDCPLFVVREVCGTQSRPKAPKTRPSGKSEVFQKVSTSVSTRKMALIPAGVQFQQSSRDSASEDDSTIAGSHFDLDCEQDTGQGDDNLLLAAGWPVACGLTGALTQREFADASRRVPDVLYRKIPGGGPSSGVFGRVWAEVWCFCWPGCQCFFFFALDFFSRCLVRQGPRV